MDVVGVGAQICGLVGPLVSPDAITCILLDETGHRVGHTTALGGILALYLTLGSLLLTRWSDICLAISNYWWMTMTGM